jgi:hypothetical protein
VEKLELKGKMDEWKDRSLWESPRRGKIGA